MRRGDPDRGAWLALAIGLGLWVAGNSYRNAFLVTAGDPPIPSLADAGRLAFYPFAYLCLGLHVRRTARGVPASIWLDGLVGVPAIAGVGVALVIGPLLSGSGGTTTELIVNTAYPIGDVLLPALVIASLGLAGGGRGTAWTLLGLGFGQFAVADTTYLFGLSAGNAEPSALLESVWLTGMAVMAVMGLAAWQRTGGHRAADRRQHRRRPLPRARRRRETLLQRADVAMYQAKTRRSGTEFYARERDLHTRERLQLIGELRDAVAREALTLHFQPKLDLGRNRITGVEALVRWPHPTRGMVPPDEFIPLVEQTGVIGPLTELVIRKALQQSAEWNARGVVLTMAVNVSATNLLERLDRRRAGRARRAWRARRPLHRGDHRGRPDDRPRPLADGARLALGVRRARRARRLRDRLLLASYLKRLPVDELKIDRSFVFEMGTDQADAAIVQTAIDLGRRLGIGVAAEGVEDAAMLRRLTDFGAGVAQGVHIARPTPADALEAWLAGGGFVRTSRVSLTLHDEDVERARPVDALHAVQLDVARGGGA